MPLQTEQSGLHAYMWNLNCSKNRVKISVTEVLHEVPYEVKKQLGKKFDAVHEFNNSVNDVRFSEIWIRTSLFSVLL